MMKHELILQNIDVSKARQELEDNPNIWDRIKLRQNIPNSAHSETESIYVRGPSEFTPEGIRNSLQSYNSKYAMENLPECLKVIAQVIKKINPEKIGRILIINLKAGQSIKKHVDNGPYASEFNRYHVPLKTNDKVISYSPSDAVNMKEGELWQYPHKVEHYIENNGDSDRWHLVLDLRAK